MHLRYRRLPATPDEDITEHGKESQQRSFVDVNLGSIQITEGFVHSTLYGLADVPRLQSVRAVACNRKAQFKRYIEARGSRHSWIELHARKIVDGVGTPVYHSDDAVESALAGGNLQSCPGNQTEGADTCNIRNVKPLESNIVRNV